MRLLHLLLRVAAMLVIAGLVGLPHVIAAADEDQELAATFDSQVSPFLRQYCVRCHRAEKLTSGIRVDHLNARLEDNHLKLWEHIREQVAQAAMPPEDEPQPTPAEKERLATWIDRALHVAKSRPTPKNGGARRLTVAQYRNTLRELLLYEDDPTDQLPPDAVSRDGFLNNQETLALSPRLVEAYFQIAEQAVERSLVDPAVKPSIQNFRVDLGEGINASPCPDKLILGAESVLLNNADFVVTQLTAKKPFAFEPFFMQTKFRFIEGYQGNDTVRGWRDFDSVYHAVFACMRGLQGYPRGRAFETVPEGLLLRPAIPSAEVFGVESTYGPRANFKISLRELPDHGRFRVTVMAAKYADGLLLDSGVSARPQEATTAIVRRTDAPVDSAGVRLPSAGIYQVDIHATESSAEAASKEKDPAELTLIVDQRRISNAWRQPAFVVMRLPEGQVSFSIRQASAATWERIAFTKLADDDPLARRFAVFERRSPQLGVHLGLRRDCGSTLSRVDGIQSVGSVEFRPYIFEGAIRNFPSPDVEKDNVNYLAGVREIGVRHEYTDGRDMPRLLIKSVEFEGPYYDTWPPATHRNLFPNPAREKEPDAYARDLIRDFGTRAFRRPLTSAEEESLFEVYRRVSSSGVGFQQSLQDVFQVVLTSPQFLFLIENSSGPGAEPLDDHELASKLSYFLWNGPPDARLLELARNGTLRSQLDAELDRLIADPRFGQFLEQFVPQWLALDKFHVLEPDRGRFPKLTRDTREELAMEPVRFVEHLFRENLPARNLIQSDILVANEIVASYYDLGERVETGYAFAALKHGRADLGGLFGQAAILAGLSNGRESNPIKRGAWMARRVMAEPPDDPPPNVPTVKDDPNLSLRERLERHRNQPGCAQCHSKIDPWGVPFEEFDAGGRFKTQPVDARSTLPDGVTVATVAELRKHLVEDRLDQVAFCVLKHLTTYATGRSLTYNELGFLKQDGLRLKGDGYRLRDMLRYVVHSPMFLEK